MVYTWNIVRDKLSRNKHDFFREKEMQDEYEVHKLSLLDQGIALEQYIKKRVKQVFILL